MVAESCLLGISFRPNCACSKSLGGVPKRRLQDRAQRMKTYARTNVTMEQWIEDNLDVGKVVSLRGSGTSGWSSQSEVTTSQGSKLFLKTCRQSDETMFKGEALGLQALYDAGAMQIPKVLGYGLQPSGVGSFILMDFLEFSGRCNDRLLGQSLAQMHLAPPKDEMASKGYFGFPVDNTIGGTPQPNGWMDNWVDFFRERRLYHQLKLTGDSQLRLGETLCNNLESFFEGIQVTPSVLHGDLWSGNIASVGGKPAIFDPAVYYGHHEAEFGMSWCAGFSGAFWQAYHDLIPKAQGFEERKQIYLLYHYLNHYNLFGSGYYGQCNSILGNLVSSL